MSHDPHLAPHAEQHPDEWHRHTADEGAPQTEHGAKAQPLALSIAFGVMVVLFVATCVVLGMYFSKYVTQARASRLETTVLADGENGSYQRRNQDFDTLTKYTWVDPATGEVAIPIAEAIDEVVSDYARSASAGN